MKAFSLRHSHSLLLAQYQLVGRGQLLEYLDTAEYFASNRHYLWNCD
jgi:hypothetical protein